MAAGDREDDLADYNDMEADDYLDEDDDDDSDLDEDYDEDEDEDDDDE